jgi:putative transposase
MAERVREFIQAMIESEPETVLTRPRYGCRPMADAQNRDGSKRVPGHRHGHCSRSLMGTFGRVEIAVAARQLDSAVGKTTEWKSSALRAYQRRTKQSCCRRSSCR